MKKLLTTPVYHSTRNVSLDGFELFMFDKPNIINRPELPTLKTNAIVHGMIKVYNVWYFFIKKPFNDKFCYYIKHKIENLRESLFVLWDSPVIQN